MNKKNKKKKKQTPQVIEVTSEELEQLIQRVKMGLSEDDAKIIINTDISNSEFQPGKKAFYLENDELKIKRIIKI